MLARDRMVRRHLSRRQGPPSPSPGQQRQGLERQYRGLIAQGRKPSYPGTLQVYRRKDIGKLSAGKLRKTLRDAYRKPSWR